MRMSDEYLRTWRYKNAEWGASRNRPTQFAEGITGLPARADNKFRVIVLSRSKLVKSGANAVCLTLLAPSCA